MLPKNVFLKLLPKLSITFIITIVITSNSNALNEFEYGVKSGLVIANRTIENPPFDVNDFNDSRIGLDLGFFINFRFSSLLHLETDFRYSPQGYIIRDIEMTTDFGSFTNITKDLDYRIDRFVIPITAEFRFSNFFSLFLGPRFDYLVARYEYLDDEMFFKKSLNDIDVGFDCGIKLRSTTIKPLIITLDLRGSPTLTTFDPHYEDIPSSALNKINYYSFEVLLGISLKSK